MCPTGGDPDHFEHVILITKVTFICSINQILNESYFESLCYCAQLNCYIHVINSLNEIILKGVKMCRLLVWCCLNKLESIVRIPNGRVTSLGEQTLQVVDTGKNEISSNILNYFTVIVDHTQPVTLKNLSEGNRNPVWSCFNTETFYDQIITMALLIDSHRFIIGVTHSYWRFLLFLSGRQYPIILRTRRALSLVSSNIDSMSELSFREEAFPMPLSKDNIPKSSGVTALIISIFNRISFFSNLQTLTMKTMFSKKNTLSRHRNRMTPCRGAISMYQRHQI